MQQKHIITTLAFAALGAVSIAGYFAYRASHAVPGNDTDEAHQVAAEIAKKVELPQDETPTLATVTNKERLDGQLFFRSAENGDKILIYPRAGRAILYRPSTGKVLEMTGVDIEKYAAGTAASSQADAASMEANRQIAVVLYNGTLDTGALDTATKVIADRFPTVTVIGRQAATRRDYEESFVVDLSGSNGDIAVLIAAAIGATVSPHALDGETVPNADLLIVIGRPAGE